MNNNKDMFLSINLADINSIYSGKSQDAIFSESRDVPLFDPQTGEPNPFYEELTGKKNPLLENKNMLSPSYEPKLNNRFIVTFPSEFNIPEWSAFSVDMPSFSIKEKKIFGIKYFEEIVWDDVLVQLYDPIDPSNSKAIMKIIETNPNIKFDFFINILDPAGITIETWCLTGCRFSSVYFGHYDYSDFNTTKIDLTITPTNVKLI